MLACYGTVLLRRANPGTAIPLVGPPPKTPRPAWTMLSISAGIVGAAAAILDDFLGDPWALLLALGVYFTPSLILRHIHNRHTRQPMNPNH